MTMQGTVNARLEPVLRVSVRGPSGIPVEVQALVDTGYTGSLALPASVAESLGLPALSGGTAELADGTSRRFNTYEAEVEWGGSWRGVAASVLGGDSLVGMVLMSGLQLRMEIVPGGLVEIGPLPWEDDA